MKSKIVLGLSIILISVGLFLVAYSFKGKWETNNAQKILHNRFVEKTIDNEVHIDNKDDSDKKIEEKKEEEKKPEEMDYLDEIDPIAIIEIPKIALKAVIAEGIEDHILKYAVGHFENTAMPGKTGNFALAGHRNYETGEFFLKLNKLIEGNDIIITTHDNKYVYKVTETFVVGPENTYVLNETMNATITLVTCTTDGRDRLIVKGELVN